MRLDVLENAREHIKEALKKFTSSIDTSGDSKAQVAQASLETAKKKRQQYIEARDNAEAEMEHYQQQENDSVQMKEVSFNHSDSIADIEKAINNNDQEKEGKNKKKRFIFKKKRK